MPNQLCCRHCGHTWQPRGGGRGYSVKCPNCNVRLGDEQFDLMRAQQAAQEAANRRNVLIMAVVGLCCCGTCIAPGVLAPFLPVIDDAPKVAKQPEPEKVQGKPVLKIKPSAVQPVEPVTIDNPPVPAEERLEDIPFSERLKRAAEIQSVDAAPAVPPSITTFDSPPAKSRHELREWHDRSFAHKTEARFLSKTGQKVKLEKPTGEIIEVEMGTLSLADQEYVKSLR